MTLYDAHPREAAHSTAAYPDVGRGWAKREPAPVKPDRRPRAHPLSATRCGEMGKQAGLRGSAHQSPEAPTNAALPGEATT